MPPPEPDAARIQRWCDNRVPAPFRSRVRVRAEVADRHVTTSQSRPPWDGEGDWISTPVARFRRTRATGLWSLYWSDRSSRLHDYETGSRRPTSLASSTLPGPILLGWPGPPPHPAPVRSQRPVRARRVSVRARAARKPA